MVLSDHLQDINTKISTTNYEQNIIFCLFLWVREEVPLTNAEGHCCTSRALVSASGQGERQSDGAGRSNWVAAAGSSASRMH